MDRIAASVRLVRCRTHGHAQGRRSRIARLLPGSQITLEQSDDVICDVLSKIALVWPKTLADLLFGKPRLAAISERHPILAAVDPFRPGRIHHITRRPVLPAVLMSRDSSTASTPTGFGSTPRSGEKALQRFDPTGLRGISGQLAPQFNRELSRARSAGYSRGRLPL